MRKCICNCVGGNDSLSEKNENRQTSRMKTLITDTGLFAISNFGSKIILFLLMPLYTNILATEEYGIADLITTTINFIYPVLTLSIAEATLRFAMKEGTSPKAVLSNSLVFVVIAVGLLLLGTPLFGLIDNSIKEHWVAFVVTFTLFNVQNCFANFIKGRGQTKLFAVQGLLHTAALVLSNICLLVFFKTGLTGYLLSIIIGYAVSVVYMFVKGKLYRELFPMQLDRQLIRQMLQYSLPMIPTTLAWAVNTSVDRYMIIGFLGLGISGIYSVAHKIPSLLTTIVNIFLQAWQLSAISNADAKDEGVYYTRIYGGLNVVCLAGCMVMIPLSKWLSGLVFADAYYTAWQSMPMLTVSVLFSSLSGFLAAAFRAHMDTKALFVSVGVGAVVNVVLNLLLIPTVGAPGAAVATAVSFFAVWCIRRVTVKRMVAIQIKDLPAMLSYGLLFAGALLVTFDVPFAYIGFLAACVVIIILNISEIKMLLTAVRVIGKSLLSKRSVK